MIRVLAAAFFWYPTFLIPALTISGIGFLFLRKNVSLNKIDLGVFIFPWILWIGLTVINNLDKSLTNAVYEPFLLGILVGVFFVIRMIKTKNEIIQNWKIVFPCIMAVTIWLFFPGLPE